MNRLSEHVDLAFLLLRIAAGLIFIVAGWGKIMDIGSTTDFFGNIGIPLPAVMAWVVAIVEFAGGFMVLAGFQIRYPALLLAIIMVVAILTTKLDADNVFRAMRLDFSLLCMSLALMITGSGRYSLDAIFGNE